jgi:PAS domain S-box-containing protein
VSVSGSEIVWRCTSFWRHPWECDSETNRGSRFRRQRERECTHVSTVSTTVTVVTGVAAVAALGYPLRVAVRSDRPSARPFAAVLAASTLWAVCIILPALPGLSAAVGSVWVWEAGRDVGSFGIPVAWLVYIRSYAGRAEWRTPGVTALALLASLTVVATNAPIPEENPASILAGLLTLATLLAAVVAFCYGAWVLYRLTGTHDRVSAWQVVTVVAVVVTPYLLRFAVGMWALARFAFNEVPVERSLDAIPVNEAAVGLLLAGAFASAAVRTYPVLSGFPPGDDAARATIVRDLREPVIVLDYDGCLLDVNDSAAETFGWAPKAVSGQPLSVVEPDLTRLDLSRDATGTAWLSTDGGRRQFQFSVSPVGGAFSEEGPLARALLLRDVTDRRTREQRLAVLNRVLRHNIRNDLDIVLAHASEIDDPATREPIRDTAQELAALATKARAVGRAMAATSEPPTEVDLVAVLTDVADQYGQRAAEVTVTAPDSLVVTTHEQVVRTVADELVENAVVHAGDAPAVTTTLTETADGVELTVADNGPGISDHDLNALEEGMESQLSHATGLGLWLVQWAVTQLGGEMDIADRDPTGTVVTIRLYT